MNIAAPTPAREMKTLTLRMPADLHEEVERAAKARGQSLNLFIADAAAAAARGSAAEPGEAGARLLSPVILLVDLDSFSARPALNVDALLRVASGLGRVVQKLSFSSAGARNLETHRHSLLTRNFRLEEVPSRDALRLRMTSEALDLMNSNAARDFVVVTADEAFGFATSLLVSHGARVVGIGVRPIAETHPDFIRAFKEDDFYFYEQIQSPPQSDELFKLRSKYADTLIAAALSLDNRKAKPVVAALVPLLRFRHPEISLALLEMRNWKELAEFVRDQGFADLESSGVDFVLRLTERGRRRAEEVGAFSEVKGDVGGIRNAIAEIVGIPLPDKTTRNLVFNAAHAILQDAESRGGMSLVALSYAVAERVGSGAVDQNTAYRLVNGLHLSGALEYHANPANERDPQIVRARIPAANFDDAFVLNLMRIRRKFPLSSSPEELSIALYGSPSSKHKVAAILEIAADAGFDRASLPMYLSRVRLPVM